MRRSMGVGIAVLAAGALCVGSGAASVFAVPGSDPGTISTAVPVVAAEAVTTLPLFGVPLTVDVSTTPNGSIASVVVNPASGLTATRVRPNRVAFVNDTATGKISVQTRHGGQDTSVRAGTLSDVSGSGGWSGDVFGTNVTTTVGFKIGAQADGSPDISAVTSSDSTATIGTVERRSDDHGQSAMVTITFSSGVQVRRLSIVVMVSTKDGRNRASAQVMLSKVTGASLPAAQVIGAHSWTGILCDGTKASVGYTVSADGTIAAGTISPATATTEVSDHHLDVQFSKTESVRIAVRSDNTDMRVSEQPRLHCDVTLPSVNTPVSTTAPGDHGGPADGPGPGGNGHGPGGKGGPTGVRGPGSNANGGPAAGGGPGGNNGGRPGSKGGGVQPGTTTPTSTP